MWPNKGLSAIAKNRSAKSREQTLLNKSMLSERFANSILWLMDSFANAYVASFAVFTCLL